MKSVNVQIEINDGIAWITLDDGKVNAMSVELMGEIDQALDKAESAGAVTVLAGREGIFSAGFDMSTFSRSGDEVRSMLLAGAHLIERLLAFSRPVVCACTGHAYPMGAFLMMASDIRIGIEGPWRIGMNEVAIGLTVPAFAIEIARHRLTPDGFSRITTAAMFSPEEAVTVGYLDQVVGSDRLHDVVRAEAKRLCTLDMTSYVGTKALINERALNAFRSAVKTQFGSDL